MLLKDRHANRTAKNPPYVNTQTPESLMQPSPKGHSQQTPLHILPEDWVKHLKWSELEIWESFLPFKGKLCSLCSVLVCSREMYLPVTELLRGKPGAGRQVYSDSGKISTSVKISITNNFLK